MPKFKKPIVVPDLAGYSVEVWFEPYQQALLEPVPKRAKRQPDPAKTKFVAIGHAVVEVSVQGAGGEPYPETGRVFTLHYYDDPGSWEKPTKGNGAGGRADAIVVNPSPKGYGDFLLIDQSHASMTAYDELEAEYRKGKNHADGCENVAKWLQKTGRVPG